MVTHAVAPFGRPSTTTSRYDMSGAGQHYRAGRHSRGASAESSGTGKSTATSNSGYGASSAAGTGVRLTCDVCRARKTRCDRAEPKCGRCKRLGLPCGYLGPRRSSRDDMSSQLLDLQDRLAKAESRLHMAPPQLENALLTPTDTSSHIHPLPPSSSASSAGFQNALRPSAAGAPSGSMLLSDDYDATYSAFADAMAGFPNLQTDLDWSPIEMPGFDSQIHMAGLESASQPPESAVALPQEGEEGLPAQELEGLHRNYFDIIYYAWPFLCRERFAAEVAARPQSPSVLSISYAVALLGTTVCPSLAHLQRACYNVARKYIDVAERSDADDDLASINILQALLCIIRYEVAHDRLVTAWLNLGRAIRLARMFGLHYMDRNSSCTSNDTHSLHVGLSENASELELEERRRTFWCLFVLESYVSTRTGDACELGNTQNLEIRLPCPGLLASPFSHTQMPLLQDMDYSVVDSSHPISSFAGCVIMVELALKCFAHERHGDPKNQANGFWDRHYALIKSFNERATALKGHLNAKAVKEDPVAFSLHMNLCAIEIYFHETAITEVHHQQFPQRIALESMRRSSSAAFKIVSAIRLNWPARRSEIDIFTQQAIFIAWPLVMATKALGRDLSSSKPNATSNGVAHSMRLLQAALDLAEQPEGYWHTQIAPEAVVLKEWDEKSGFDTAIV